jgi:hypothetical protein
MAIRHCLRLLTLSVLCVGCNMPIQEPTPPVSSVWTRGGELGRDAAVPSYDPGLVFTQAEVDTIWRDARSTNLPI